MSSWDTADFAAADKEYLWRLEHDGALPDLKSLDNALSDGYFVLSITLITEQISLRFCVTEMTAERPFTAEDMDAQLEARP